ncbi:hypothetical protein BDD12DRAFT_914436, partial [Trichophaea hybrida]
MKATRGIYSITNTKACVPRTFRRLSPSLLQRSLPPPSAGLMVPSRLAINQTLARCSRSLPLPSALPLAGAAMWVTRLAAASTSYAMLSIIKTVLMLDQSLTSTWLEISILGIRGDIKPLAVWIRAQPPTPSRVSALAQTVN